MPELLNVRLITNEDDFLNIREQWNALLAKSTSDAIFLTWEFQYTWWQSYKTDKELTIILVEQDGKIIGIAPLYAAYGRVLSITKKKQVEIIGGHGAFFENLDFIVERGCEEMVLREIISFLFSKDFPKWDIIFLSAIRETSVVMPLFQSLLKEKRIHNSAVNTRESLIVQLPDTFENYVGAMSKNTRNGVKYSVRKFEKLSDIKLEVVQHNADIQSVFDDFVQIHQKRQSVLGKEGSFRVTRKAYNTFHKRIVDLIEPLGWLYFVFLKQGKTNVAAYYNFLYHNKMSSYAIGLNPDFAQYSPGKVLMYKLIEQLYTTHIRCYDFLRGTDEYKYHWTKHVIKSSDLAVWRSHAIYRAMSIEKGLRSLPGKVSLFKNVANWFYGKMITREDS